MSKGLLKLGALSLSALAFTLVLTAANAQERVRWKMQSAFGSSLPHLGPSGVRFSKDIERMSGGQFEVKFYEPGALIPPLECFDSVSKGAIESCWTTPGYHTGKYPALAFFTTVPFGPNFGEFMANKAAWDKLPAPYTAMVEVAGQAQVAVTYAESEAMQFDAMAEMRDKYKVQVKRWDDATLAAFEKAWLEVIKEESAKDATFKKVADHYLDFRKRYAIWGDAQVMKPTYLK